MSDIELKHYDKGDGAPAIMFVHGFCCLPDDWADQVVHFAKAHRCISVALRGHGVTERGSAALSMEQMATDCVGLLRDKGIEKAVVVGHSMGTRIAIEAHRQAPDVVAGLVLVDGSNATAATDLDSALSGFEQTVQTQGYAAFADMLFRQMFSDPKYDALKEKTLAQALSIPEEVGRPLYDNLIRWDGNVARDALRATSIPILVIQSTTRDASGGRRPLEAGETGAYEALVKECAPHADVTAMPGLGHFTMIEGAGEVNGAIDGWLDKHGLSSGS